MSRVAKVRERVLALRQANPELPAHKIAKAVGVRVAMVRRVLGEPTPPRIAPVLNPERFNWKQQGRGCDRLLQRINQFHPDAQAA
jgi:hypothetical protein